MSDVEITEENCDYLFGIFLNLTDEFIERVKSISKSKVKEKSEIFIIYENKKYEMIIDEFIQRLGLDGSGKTMPQVNGSL